MAKLSKVDAAKAAGVSRQTLYTYIKDHRLSVDADGLIDTAELLRAGFALHTLHEVGRPIAEPVGQVLTSRLDTLDVYQDMSAMLKQQLSEAQAREQVARDREALLLQLLLETQQQNQRLLDMPRNLPMPNSSQRAPAAPEPPRGEIGPNPTLILVANSQMRVMILFTMGSEGPSNRVDSYAETPDSVGESGVERMRHQYQH